MLLEIAWWIWLLLLYGLGTLAAIDALWQGRTAQGTVAWCLALIATPFIAIPLYLLFGSRRFHGYLRARKHDHEDLNRCADLAQKALAPWVQQRCEITAPFYTLFKVPLVSGNSWQLLTSGKDFYSSMFEDIAAAKDYVCVQFYILRADNSGQHLADALCEKARSGVATFLIYDEIGSGGLDKHYIQRLKDAGVMVTTFNSPRLRTRAQLNFRNHRKLVICDGRLAYVGGYNLGDEYLGDGISQTFWRDTHIRIEGPSALSFQLAFTEDWHWATSNIPELSWHAFETQGSANIMCAATGPADDTESASLFFAHLIHNAKKRCWLVSPYFVPDQNLFNALQLAGLRGIDIRILVPGESDSFLVQNAMRVYIAGLKKCHVSFYTYKKGFLHQKVMLIDDEWSCIGSANLDNRSLRINFEINALIQDPALAQELEAMLLKDFQDSEPTVLPSHWWPQFLSKACRLLSPIL